MEQPNVIFFFVLLILGAWMLHKYIELSSKKKELDEFLAKKDARVREAVEEAVEEALAATAAGHPGQPAAQAPSSKEDVKLDRASNVEYLEGMIDEIGCRLEIDKEDDSLSFKYQGEQFFLEYNGVYLRIWDPAWLRVPNDHPSFRDTLKAINETNYGFGPTVVYTIPDTSGSIAIHSRFDIYFPKFADNDPDFLKHSLNLFFDTKQSFATHMKQMDENGTNLPNPSVLNPLIPSNN